MGSPSKKILERFKSPVLHTFLQDLRYLVKEHRDNPKELSQKIGVYLDDQINVLVASRKIINEEYNAGDHVLAILLSSLYKKMGGGDFQRQYAIRFACDHTLPGLDSRYISEREGQILKKKGALCSYVNELRLPVDKYVLESAFVEGIFDQQVTNGFKIGDLESECPDCGSEVSIWNTANLVVPQRHFAVDYIASRLKSDGRRNSKLTEVICFDERIQEKGDLRNLDDDYGLAIVFKDISSLIGHYKKQVQRFISENYIEKLLYNLGIRVNGIVSETDKFYYATLCWLQRTLGKGTMAAQGKGLDDNIGNPKERWNKRKGVSEYLYEMRVKVIFMGVPLELKLKPRSVVDAEADPNSALFHASYAFQKRLVQKQTWTETHYIVENLLNRTLNRVGE